MPLPDLHKSRRRGGITITFSTCIDVYYIIWCNCSIDSTTAIDAAIQIWLGNLKKEKQSRFCIHGFIAYNLLLLYLTPQQLNLEPALHQCFDIVNFFIENFLAPL
jgi:hypothetical protein